MKADALGEILAGVSPAASLICVTRWKLQDLILGASDVECRTMIDEFGGSFRLHPSLHAKYYRADDVVLIGSANLTSPAMGFSPFSNVEILCRAADDFDAGEFQQKLLGEAREVSDEEFARWDAAIKINAQGDSPAARQPHHLDSWRPATRVPEHLELVYQGRVGDIASLDEQRAAKRDIQALSVPPDLTGEQLRQWASVCLLTSSFTNTVIRLQSDDAASAIRKLAATYSLGIVEARRDMETVHNWLAALAPETLHAL